MLATDIFTRVYAHLRTEAPRLIDKISALGLTTQEKVSAETRLKSFRIISRPETAQSESWHAAWCHMPEAATDGALSRHELNDRKFELWSDLIQGAEWLLEVRSEQSEGICMN